MISVSKKHFRYLQIYRTFRARCFQKSKEMSETIVIVKDISLFCYTNLELSIL